MTIESNTFTVSRVNGDAEYALHSDDSVAHLSFDYAVWVDTGGREDRLGFYSNGCMPFSIDIEAIDIEESMLEEILLNP